jgi:hypothetical protein
LSKTVGTTAPCQASAKVELGQRRLALDPRPRRPPDDRVRNGYEGIRITFAVKGDATPQQLDELAQLAQRRSPVFDIVTNPVPVTVRIEQA